MNEYKGSRCSKCGRAIKWVKTPKGKWMPLDAGLIPYRLNPEGKDTLIDDGGRAIRVDIPDIADPLIDGYARRSHWATCPYADDFRKKADK